MQAVFVPLWVLLSTEETSSYCNRSHHFSLLFPHHFLTYFTFCTHSLVPFSQKSFCFHKEISSLPFCFIALKYIYIYIFFYILFYQLLLLYLFSSPLHLPFSFNLFVLAYHVIQPLLLLYASQFFSLAHCPIFPVTSFLPPEHFYIVLCLPFSVTLSCFCSSFSLECHFGIKEIVLHVIYSLQFGVNGSACINRHIYTQYPSITSKLSL